MHDEVLDEERLPLAADAGWVDTHAHLFLIDDDSRDVLSRARDARVEWVVSPGVDVASSEASRALCERFPLAVRWTAGLHPHEAQSWPEVADRIAELAIEAHAVGECGLDWYRNLAPRADQLTAFKAQLAIAVELGKPIVIHCRDAFRDVFDILEDAAIGERAILHCWTGGTRWTKRFDELGVTFSFAGPLTFSKDDTLRLGAAFAPPGRTVLETDSPYLTPEPLGHRPNEPANLPLTASVLAEIWGMNTNEVAAVTTANATRLFGDPRA